MPYLTLPAAVPTCSFRFAYIVYHKRHLPQYAIQFWAAVAVVISDHDILGLLRHETTYCVEPQPCCLLGAL